MLRRMRRLVCLDGLRGALATYVMLSHTLPFAPTPGWLHWLFQHGGAGVDVFFILSGLVIVQSLDSFGYRALPFLIARVARIYPVFLVVFAFAVAVQPLQTGFEQMAWIGPDSPARSIWSGGWPQDWGGFIATHMTMTHGLFPNGVLPNVWVGFLGAAWSLSTEWQFYLLALLIGARLGPRRMAWLFLAMSAASIAWHAMVPESWQFSRAFLPNKAQYFALGVVSAIVARDGPKGLPAYLVVLATTLALCAVQGGIDKLLPPAHLDGLSCGPGLLSVSARAGVPRLDPRFRGNDVGDVGGRAAIQADGLARGRLVLHLPGQRAGAKAGWGDAGNGGAGQCSAVHHDLDSGRRRSATARIMVAARVGGAARPALWPSHGGRCRHRRMNVQ